MSKNPKGTRNPAKSSSTEKSVRIDSAVDAAFAAAPGSDDPSTWAASVAKRIAAFKADYDASDPERKIQTDIQEKLFQIEKIVGLESPHREFRDCVITAIKQSAEPHISQRDARARLVKASDAANSVAKNLMSLYDGMIDLPPQYTKGIFSADEGWLVPEDKLDQGQLHNSIVKEMLAARAANLRITIEEMRSLATRFEELSTIADRRAKMFKKIDKGGRAKYLGFNVLVVWLAEAFKIATNREAKVTWNQHAEEYGGTFLQLIEAVLPLAEAAARLSGRSFKYPVTPLARGKFVFEITRRGAPKPTGLFG